MDRKSKSWRSRFRAAVACLLMFSGCSTLRLPAVDPSGQSIFLPTPAYTTIAPPPSATQSRWPRPAFVAPPDPPPCDPATGAPVGTVVAPQPGAAAVTIPPAQVSPPLSSSSPALLRGARSRPWNRQYVGRLIVNPTRLVAPVGSEVILRAGICGEDGYFITRQPIEWMLSRESVGTLVNVNTQGQPLWRRIRDRPQTRSNDYVVGWTSTVAQVLGRQSPLPTDDVVVLQGQSWVSVTSTTEGASHITVHAPSAVGWDARRQTATIHWVDGQWSFPAPAVARAGQPVQLTTNVRRNTSANPVVGWLVRYEVVAGPAVTLDGHGVQVVEARTDSQGNAQVQVTPQASDPGVTQIRIQVIRTSTASGDLPRLVVGQGATSITWSAPGLNVRTAGPSVAELNSTLTYRVEVSNPGDLPSPDVVVSIEIPDGLTYLDSNPPAQVFGNRLQWRVGQLAALELRGVEIRFRATRSGTVRLCASARRDDGVTRESCVTTRIAVRALSVSMEGAEQAQVGEQVQFRITVTNTGDRPLTNVLIIDRFDPGLRHVDRTRPDAITPSPIERSLGSLAPGESRSFAVTFLVQQPGELCHTLKVISSDGATAVARMCVTATPRPAEPSPEPPSQPSAESPSQPLTDSIHIQSTTTGPEQRRVGEIAEFSIEFSNDGETTLTSVRVVQEFDPELELVDANPSASRGGNQLTWLYEVIEPGQTGRMQIRYRCTTAAPRACVVTSVTADQDIQGSDESCVEILTPPAAERPAERPRSSDEGPIRLNGPSRDNAANGLLAPPRPEEQQNGVPIARDGLSVTVFDLGDPVRAGETVTYVIEITNHRQVNDKNVKLSVILPEGTRQFTTLPPPLIRHNAGSDGRTITFTPIAEMRAGETIPFRITVTFTEPGPKVLKAEVSSLQSETPVTAEEDTTVFQ